MRRRALVLLMRYSMELNEAVERIAGETSGNNEIRVLAHLFVSGPSGRHAVTALTGLSRSGVTQLLERLDQVGLVESARGELDHRTVISALTPLGRVRVRMLEEEFGDYFSSPNPLIKELLDLLQPTGSSPGPATPAMPALAKLDRLGDVGARLTRQFHTDVGLADPRQLLALATLADWGDARPGQLAEVLGLTSGSTTYLVDQLESAGIVERLYGIVPTDRRAVEIRLTASGLAASERLADALFEHADEFAGVLVAVHRT